MKLLIIEDERKTANALKRGLEDSGYGADVAYDGEAGLSLINTNKYNLVISDIIMPRLNGLDLCRKVRAFQNRIPILLLTALDSKGDIVTGLDVGADDYLTKPFDFRELLARIRNLTRRMEASAPNDSTLLFSDIIMNMQARTVTREGKAIELTVKEFKLLEYFMKRANIVISRSELARNIWDIDFDTGTNVVEVYINYLRNKVDKPFNKKLIHNIHGIGYILKES